MKLHQAEHGQDEGDEAEDEEKRVHMDASRRPQKARGAFLACGRGITLPRVENAATGFLANPGVNPGVVEVNDEGSVMPCQGRLSATYQSPTLFLLISGTGGSKASPSFLPAILGHRGWPLDLKP